MTIADLSLLFLYCFVLMFTFCLVLWCFSMAFFTRFLQLSDFDLRTWTWDLYWLLLLLKWILNTTRNYNYSLPFPSTHSMHPLLQTTKTSRFLQLSLLTLSQTTKTTHRFLQLSSLAQKTQNTHPNSIPFPSTLLPHGEMFKEQIERTRA